MKIITRTGEQSEADPYEFVMSSGMDDRMGDRIAPDGIDLKAFKKNPIALFAHKHDLPVGTWENVRIEGSKLIGRLKLAAKGTSQLIDQLHSLLEQRILRAVSIGFGVHEYEENEKGGFNFLKTELYECSVVSVPANARALRVKGLTLIEGHRDGTGLPSAKKAAAKGQPPQPPKGATPTSDKPMKIADRILAKRARLADIEASLADIQKRIEADDADESLIENEQDNIEALTDEKAAVQTDLDRLEALEKSTAQRATPVSTGVAPTRQRVPAPQGAHNSDGQKFLLARMALAHARAHAAKMNIMDYVERDLKGDRELQAIIKSSVGVADTTTSGWARELISEGTGAFLEEIRAVSIFGQLRGMGVSIPFGNNASVKMPFRASRGQAHANWVGEGGVIPVESLAFASKTFTANKVAAIVPVTNELIRGSSQDVLGIIQSALLEDFAMGVDAALLDGLPAVVGVRPASIINGIPGVPSTGNTLEQINSDVNAAYAPLEAAGNVVRPVMILNNARVRGLSSHLNLMGGYIWRDEVSRGTFGDATLISSINAPDDLATLLDASSFASAYGNPEFEVDSSATIVLANADGTAPTHATDGAGDLGTPNEVKPDGGISVVGGADSGAATAGYQAMSMFQTYSTSVRLVMPLAWGMLRQNAINTITGIDW